MKKQRFRRVEKVRQPLEFDLKEQVYYKADQSRAGFFQKVGMHY